MLKVFELHTYREGVWRIDSVYDDRELALMEAKRVDHAGRYSAVRVIEETFNEETDKSVVRTVFRSSRHEKNAAPRAAKAASGSKQAAPSKKSTKKRRSIGRQLVIASLTLVAIISGGLALLYYVHTL